MKRQVTLLLLLLAFTISAQKTCDTPQEDILEDLNSIAKCTIKPSGKKGEKSKQISVRVSAPKKRFLKKRPNTVKSATNLSTTGVNSTNSKSVIYKNNITKLTKKLSSEELKNAKKFMVADEVPAFSACANTKGEARVDCFNAQMIKHIEAYFNYPNDAVIKKIQGEVWVRFVIDKDGHVANIKTLGPKNGEILEQEALRVVSKLPQFIPGTKGGKNISIKYGFPINFSLDQ